MPGHDGPGRPQAVNGRADDPPSVSGPFATGVEPEHGGALACGVVPGDSDGRGAPRLGAGQDGVSEEGPSHLPVHHRQASFEGLHHRGRQDQAEVGGDCPSLVAGADLASAGPAVEEVAGPLDRGVIGPVSRRGRRAARPSAGSGPRPGGAGCRGRPARRSRPGRCWRRGCRGGCGSCRWCRSSRARSPRA